MTRAEVRIKIKAVLDLLITGGTLADVKDYHTAELQSYPTVTFENSDTESDFETTDSNLRTFAYRLVIRQQFSTITKSEAIEVVDNVVDELLTTFENDFELGNVVDILELLPSISSSYEEQETPIYFSEIILKARASKQLN